MRTILHISALLVFGVVLNAQLLEVDGDVDVAGGQIHSVGDPTNAQDAATKAYVDALENQLILLKNTIIAGGFVQDFQGNNYNTVKIGTQTWMAENLNVGIRIDGANDQSPAPFSLVEKYCYADLKSNCEIYGALYQWDEMMRYSTTEGATGICPSGWHIPTDAEWAVLINYLGVLQGRKMKEPGQLHWDAPNEGATNESGFTGLPGGFRTTVGTFFNDIGSDGLWWSSSEGFAGDAWYRKLENDDDFVRRGRASQIAGFSVRCLRDD